MRDSPLCGELKNLLGVLDHVRAASTVRLDGLVPQGLVIVYTPDLALATAWHLALIGRAGLLVDSQQALALVFQV